MSDLPYTTDLLRLAAEANGAGRLTPPCLSHTEHNPACGDRTTMDLRLDHGRIAAVAQDTQACVLTQAAASILGGSLHGTDAAGLRRLREEVQAMLDGGPPPAEPFGRFRYLSDVAKHPGRHRCVLLPLDAAIKALESERSEPG